MRLFAAPRQRRFPRAIATRSRRKKRCAIWTSSKRWRAQRARARKIEARAYRRARDAHNALRLKLYVLGGVLPLSASLPMFENLGLRVIAEDSYPVTLEDRRRLDAATARVLDFLMERADEGPADLDDIKAPLEDAFHAVVRGAGRKRRLQPACDRRRACLARRDHPAHGREISAPGGLRLQPGLCGAGACAQSRHRRTCWSNCSTRCNDPRAAGDRDRRRQDDPRAHRCRAERRAEPRRRPHHPPPAQCHRLRAAHEFLPARRERRSRSPISPSSSTRRSSTNCPRRGRWSRSSSIRRKSKACICASARWRAAASAGRDRREDFRTEILGLVKAQQVKNAVIVPVGSKGGFYPKQLPVNAHARGGAGSRHRRLQDLHQRAARSHRQYRIPTAPSCRPSDVRAPRRRRSLSRRRRRQGHRDLLRHRQRHRRRARLLAGRCVRVAAAATATTTRRWASPRAARGKRSSAISARWAATSRANPSPCVGVGDMSGDVFGNGMLLSKQTQAASRRSITATSSSIPIPIAAKAVAERKRMFDLPRSSWADYDKTLISKGGGVFARTLKEIRADAGDEGARPASTDGQGYARRIDQGAAESRGRSAVVRRHRHLHQGRRAQSNLDAGDRANDAVRVNGGEVRAKVVGEGANLGATQLGRIEYALRGRAHQHRRHRQFGRRRHLRPRSESEDPAQRSAAARRTHRGGARRSADRHDRRRGRACAERQLRSDAGAVGRAIARASRTSTRMAASCAIWNGAASSTARSNSCPTDEELRKRAQDGNGPDAARTRGAAGLCQARSRCGNRRRAICRTIRYFAAELAGYFPHGRGRRASPTRLEQHRLRREIISTVLANRIVNLAGPVFVHRMKEISGAPACARGARLRAWRKARSDLSALKARIDALD